MTSFRARVKASPLVRSALFLAQDAWYGVLSLAAPRPAPPAPEGPQWRLAAMIRVKDEARFLPEWLAHHLELGVEHVVVYDNGSTDGTAEAAAPFVAEGTVTVVPWPIVPASPSSHLDFLTRFGPRCEWAAFLDADEFLVESAPGALDAALVAVGRAPALAVPWRYFGSAGHDRVPAGLVTERFQRADPGLCDHIKVIARPAEVFRYRNPHNFYYRRGRLARTAQGRRVFGSFVRPPAAPPALHLHHYVYRSREDYEHKLVRGFADAAGPREAARREARVDAEFERHNDIVVTVPDRMREATAARLRRLGYPAELYLADPGDPPIDAAAVSGW
jgi:Glycosyl transferase family 2